MYNPNQFGFRNHRGTTHAIAVVTEKIAQLKADRGQCQVILRDVTKAFDQVWHRGLMYKILVTTTNHIRKIPLRFLVGSHCIGKNKELCWTTLQPKLRCSTG